MAEINNNDGKIKVIAFYLPQYHTIIENDAAWGKGFTEWVNVKKAYPYFKNHYQPRIPLNNNYYSLLDSTAQAWQANLAQKYSVFGFCYYHYWFKDGKKLLEKPAENMLNNKNINQPFCFCWANENWTKTWTGGDDEIIALQDYGDENEWKKHFEYFLMFFKDKRYITFNGKPILIIYKPELIPHFKEMIEFFRREIVQEGFPGIEIMVQFPNYLSSKEYNEEIYDHYIDFEPVFSTYEMEKEKKSYDLKKILIRFFGKKIIGEIKKVYSKPTIYSYDDIWNRILRRKLNEKFILGAFTDWDNSPRKKRSVLFEGSTPQKFEYYLEQLFQKIVSEKRERIVFINAWNEWGEGAYLEPDEKYQYGYLEAVRNVVEKSKYDK